VTSYVADALANLALHARQYAESAAEVRDERNSFVYSELVVMLESLAEGRSSPLLEALGGKMQKNGKDSAYQDARRIAVALVVLWMRNGLKRGHACNMAAEATGVPRDTLDKKCRIPSDPRGIARFLEEDTDILETLGDHAVIAGSGTDEALIHALQISAANNNLGRHVMSRADRVSTLEQAMTFSSDSYDNFHLQRECNDKLVASAQLEK